MEYINKQICDFCFDEKNKYKFECESCGLLIISCKHNVFKCNECDNFFCAICSKKYQHFERNTILCNQCK